MPNPTPAPAGTGGIRFIGRALRSRNYRLFFVGQGTSLVGTWLTRVATAWLVYRLTGSELQLGLVGFAGQIPTFLLAPFAGVQVDRWDRRRILLVTQVLAMLQSAALAYFALSGTIRVAHVLALSVAQGVINAFDTPARQAFVVEMVDHREDLPNAIALNSSMVNGARLVGPSVAGMLIALTGEGWCFAIDALSYVAVVASLLAMRVAPRAQRARTHGGWFELREGFAYVAGFVPIRSLLLLLALVGLMGMPYSVLMPVMAHDVLHGGPHTLGLLTGAAGLGALVGALYLASRSSVRGLGRIVPAAAALFGAGLIAFSRSRWLALSLPLMLLVGAGMMVQMAASNTLLQTIADEDKRGRVMSFYTMAFFGSAPFGSLLAGTLAARLGSPDTILIGGVACIAGAGLFVQQLPALRRTLRPVYVRLGIIPEAAEDAARAQPHDA